MKSKDLQLRSRQKVCVGQGEDRGQYCGCVEDEVKDPVAVRYAWLGIHSVNLYNKEDLPASPFRTDNWPGLQIIIIVC